MWFQVFLERKYFVSSCWCSVFVFYMHPVAVLNAALCVVLSLLIFLKDAGDYHMDEAMWIIEATWLPYR